jgi:hypothetical protein
MERDQSNNRERNGKKWCPSDPDDSVSLYSTRETLMADIIYWQLARESSLGPKKFRNPNTNSPHIPMTFSK